MLDFDPEDLPPLPPITDQEIKESVALLVKVAQFLRIVAGAADSDDPGFRAGIAFADNVLNRWRDHLGLNPDSTGAVTPASVPPRSPLFARLAAGAKESP